MKQNSAQAHKYKTEYLKNKALYCMSPTYDNRFIFAFAAISASIRPCIVARLNIFQTFLAF